MWRVQASSPRRRRHAPRCSRRWRSTRRCGKGNVCGSSSLTLRVFQSINDQLPVLLEDPESFLEGLQHLLGPRGVLASLFYFPDEFVVAGDVVLAFGNMPISLGQRLAFVHRSRPRLSHLSYLDAWWVFDVQLCCCDLCEP